jgi:hypothetical protein
MQKPSHTTSDTQLRKTITPTKTNCKQNHQPHQKTKKVTWKSSWVNDLSTESLPSRNWGDCGPNYDPVTKPAVSSFNTVKFQKKENPTLGRDPPYQTIQSRFHPTPNFQQISYTTYSTKQHCQEYSINQSIPSTICQPLLQKTHSKLH